MSVRLAVTGSNPGGDVPFSVALSRGGDVHCLASPAGRRGDLAGLCRDLCAQHDVAPADIGEVLVDVGPGSYTGLRVAVTFVRFLQAFGNVDVHSVDSLALLVRHAIRGREREFEGRQLRALLDARRGRLHTAAFAVIGGALQTRTESQAVPTEEQLARLTGDDVVVAPDAMLATIADLVQERGVETIAAQGLTAAALFDDGLPFRRAEAADLEPRYLMQSYAEQ